MEQLNKNKAMEDQKLLRKKLKNIEKWEKNQKGLFFWEKIGRLPFVLLDKLTPTRENTYTIR